MVSRFSFVSPCQVCAGVEDGLMSAAETGAIVDGSTRTTGFAGCGVNLVFHLFSSSFCALNSS